MDDNMDALFASFMTEVNSAKSSKMKKIEHSVGNPDEIIMRLTSTRYDPKQGFGSAFAMLSISPEASEGEINKQYKRLSILIHPDKCSNPQASEAFQVLVKAYNDSKDPNYNDKYKDLLGPAKRRVRERREKQNEERKKKREDPLDMEGNDFDQEVLKECEAMTTQVTERSTYTNSVMEANMKRIEEQRKMARGSRKEEDAEKRKFEKNRDKRAAGWQTFVNNCETKKFKSQHFLGKVGAADVNHKREQRTTSQGKGEIDLTDKKILRSDTQAGHTGIDRTYKQAWR